MNKIPLFKVYMSPKCREYYEKVITPREDGSIYVGQGEVVEQFEDSLQSLFESPVRPLTTNSCTSALSLALNLLDIGPGDSVISVPQTCFTSQTPIVVEGGGTMLIGKIVNQKIDVRVLSYNESSGEFEYKKILNWIKVPADPTNWYRLTLKNAKTGVWVTGDHKILTDKGYVRVDSLNSSHKIATSQPAPSPQQEEVINGMLLGNGRLSGYRFSTAHTEEHEQYIEYIRQALEGFPFSPSAPLPEKAEVYMSLQTSTGDYWRDTKNKWYSIKGRKVVPEDLELTPRTLAVWYMDNGILSVGDSRYVVFCTDNFCSDSFWRLFYKMVDLGFKPTVTQSPNRRKGRRIVLGEQHGCVDKFFKMVSPYIIPCFRYKVPTGFSEFDESLWNLPKAHIYYSEFEVEKGDPPPQHHPNQAYCLEVEDNHNFVTHKMVVSNCSATNLAIYHTGASIVWADIDPRTGLIDPTHVESIITRTTKAIVSVDWGGSACDYFRLKEFGIPVIQDAAHALLGKYNGESIAKAGGDFVCYSFQAIKHLTTNGDGGAIIVPEDQYKRAKLKRWYGLDRESSDSFRCAQDITEPGLKWHMNDVSACGGLANLEGIVERVNRHREIAKIYSTNISNREIYLPPYDEGSSYWVYTVIVESGRRDSFASYMESKGVSVSQVHRRNDLYSCFSNFRSSHLPGLEFFSSRQICIPCGWWMTDIDVERVIDAVNSWTG